MYADCIPIDHLFLFLIVYWNSDLFIKCVQGFLSSKAQHISKVISCDPLEVLNVKYQMIFQYLLSYQVHYVVFVVFILE